MQTLRYIGNKGHPEAVMLPLANRATRMLAVALGCTTDFLLGWVQHRI